MLGGLNETVDASDIAGPPSNGTAPGKRGIFDGDVERSKGSASSEVNTSDTVDKAVGSASQLQRQDGADENGQVLNGVVVSCLPSFETTKLSRSDLARGDVLVAIDAKIVAWVYVVVETVKDHRQTVLQ